MGYLSALCFSFQSGGLFPPLLMVNIYIPSFNYQLTLTSPCSARKKKKKTFFLLSKSWGELHFLGSNPTLPSFSYHVPIIFFPIVFLSCSIMFHNFPMKSPRNPWEIPVLSRPRGGSLEALAMAPLKPATQRQPLATFSANGMCFLGWIGCSIYPLVN